MGCTASQANENKTMEKKTQQELQFDTSKYANVVFSPEPISESDLIVIDQDGNAFVIHRVFLMHHSCVYRGLFNDLDWSTCSHTIKMNYPHFAVLTCMQLIYGVYQPQDCIIKLPSLLQFWHLCHQYQFPWETMCSQKILNGLNNNQYNKTIDDLCAILHIAAELQHQEIVNKSINAIVELGFTSSLLAKLNQKEKDLLLMAACKMKQ